MIICNTLCSLYSNLLNKIAIRKSPYSSATPCTYMLLPRIWGAALLVGRSRDRFPVVSLEFSVICYFRPYHGPGVDSAPSENEYQEHFLGVKVAGEWTTSLPSYAESHENLGA